MFPPYIIEDCEAVLEEWDKGSAELSKDFPGEVPQRAMKDVALTEKDYLSPFNLSEDPSYLRSSGFHTELLLKSALRNASRCAGFLEQTWRNSQPP